MFKDSLKLHGQKQFEVKQKIFCPEGTKHLEYRIDTYFFFPGALQITEANFENETFRRNLKCYLRLRGPNSDLREVSVQTAQLEKLLTEHQTDSSKETLETNLKHFCLAYKTALQKEYKKLSASTDNSALETFLSRVTDILQSFRSLKAKYNSPGFRGRKRN